MGPAEASLTNWSELELRARPLFIFDLDGVVWAGDEEVPGAAQAIAQFRAAGKQVAFLSNNSGRHPTKVERKARRLGVPSPSTR